MEKESRRQKRLVLFPCPLQGHINPMLQLATILDSKGFSIILVHTKFNAPNSSNYPNFCFIPISDNLTESQASTPDFIYLISQLNQNCIAPFKDCLVNLLSQQHQQEPIACIITDAIMHFTKDVADHLQLPRFVLRTSGAASFVIYAALPLLRHKGYLTIKDSKLEAPIAEHPPLKVKDLPGFNYPNPDALNHLLDHMISKTKASSALIWNSFESLEKSALETVHKDFGIPVFPIGPFHKIVPASSSSLLTQDQNCISWLNTQSPGTVLYVSFGSLASMDKADLMEIAWGLANCERPFLWVLRPGLVRDCSSTSDTEQLLPPTFYQMVSARSYIVKWAPQQDVLAHPSVGGFWTHCGWNSTMESICEGVPMICWPCFGDQKVNARYVSNVWKVGLLLEHGLQKEEIESAITKLMVGKEREEIMVRVMDLKEKAELCLLKGGSSFNSLQSLIDLFMSF